MAGSDMGKIVERIIGKRRRERMEGEVSPPPEPSKIYLKALSLRSLEDLEKIKSEIRSGNILIVKIEPLLNKDIEDVKRAISELSEFIESVGGDIARLGEERIVLTPRNVRIWRERQTTSSEASSM
ncbi:MAG: cell division protein SepF [Candidatus Bathyarchaeia archaeon]